MIGWICWRHFVGLQSTKGVNICMVYIFLGSLSKLHCSLLVRPGTPLNQENLWSEEWSLKIHLEVEGNGSMRSSGNMSMCLFARLFTYQYKYYIYIYIVLINNIFIYLFRVQSIFRQIPNPFSQKRPKFCDQEAELRIFELHEGNGEMETLDKFLRGEFHLPSGIN